MAKGVSGKRHAQAVFQIASENGTLENWHTDLKAMKSVLGNAEVARLLDSPKLSSVQKRQVVESVLAGVSPTAMNLAHLLVSKNRLGIICSLLNEYEDLMNSHFGRETAVLTTAFPLGEQEKQRILNGLAKIAGKELVINTDVDPEIMGGLVARIGDTLIDGSVRAGLLQLRENLR